ncbi:hypothetical protein [Chryseobacterium profundimaris]|uniref:Uncharacterized protein n=1 Tax=Chryseobacterium profundimaris TaxID=1387275 RepID=A0ABY1NMB7_9FLAO|nr:hypothetical protein [Chryseobacterium profundimaris]SMP13292.1 hypothetical protein SAMN06264346_102576 [Chryseobacterium profundimaris]
MKRILPIYLIVCLYSCSQPERKKITYRNLPSDVRAKFENVYHYKTPPVVNAEGDTVDWYSPPFAECFNLKNNCKCNVESKGGVISNPYFVITSCGKESEISWEILQRVFIIKNDSIYFPNAKNAVTTTGESRAFNIKLDTISFYVQEMN